MAAEVGIFPELAVAVCNYSLIDSITKGGDDIFCVWSSNMLRTSFRQWLDNGFHGILIPMVKPGLAPSLARLFPYMFDDSARQVRHSVQGTDARGSQDTSDHGGESCACHETFVNQYDRYWERGSFG
ncbi:uncharacterized protein ATNIH1004_002944 [Aspergillus tanneri]|nr:uncharacterized protein ATNIH1004_002944 [Aspergillus tanneri]KAA8650262.1 hypothetical protein ATNIH1004_002944 [Aspergillus tanneri]